MTITDHRPTTSPVAPHQVPPHNPAAESSLLGAMILTRAAIDDAIEIVSTEHFYDPANQRIFEAISDMHAAGEAVDTMTLASKLATRGHQTDTVPLLELQAMTPVATNAAGYAKLVYNAAVHRRLIATGREISQIGFEEPENVTAAVDRAETMLFKVAQGHVAGDIPTGIGDLIEGALDDFEKLLDSKGAITGTPTGFPDLDRILSGLQASSLVVIGARPAMGKTSLALNMAAHAAIEHDTPVLVFSLEMSKLELSKRLMCSDARVNAANMRTGRTSEDDWKKIADATGRLADAPLFIDDTPDITLNAIRSKARRLTSTAGKLGMIVVDYLQLMTGRSNAENRQVEVAELSRGLKILARELDCPVVALSQLSRNLESRQDKRPMLADLRESGAIEQDADVVMFLYRDEVYNPDTAHLGIAEIAVAKHRNGPTGTARLVFLPHYTRFVSAAKGA